MMELRDLERFRYWQGQGLRSRDFRAQRANAEELRWWHNRALHDSGVRSGLTVAMVDGADFVRVACGLAYDCYGRELLLQRDRQVPYPDSPEEGAVVVLVIRYRSANEDACVCNASDLPPDCAPPGLMEDAVAFHWHDANELRPSDGAPLAAFRFSDGAWSSLEISEALDGASPPASRPMARPQLASGGTIPGQTVWEVWRWGSVPLGFQTLIDTSAAGFTKTPLYFAELTTEKPLLSSDFFPPLFNTHVAEPKPGSFLLRVVQPLIPARVGVINARGPVSDGPFRSAAAPGFEVENIAAAQRGTLLVFRHEAGGAPTGVQISAVDAEASLLALDTAAPISTTPSVSAAVQSFLPFFLLWFPGYAQQQELKVAWLACGGHAGSGARLAESRCPGTRPAPPEPCEPGCGCGCGSKPQEDSCL